MIPVMFKVLGAEGEAIHGGSGMWPLPRDDQPGEWLDAGCEPKCCSRGLHIVSDPLMWWRSKARLFLVEPDWSSYQGDGSEKCAVRRARLLAEVTCNDPWIVMYPRVRAFLAASARSMDEHCDISWASLDGMSLDGASLRCASLDGASLVGASLYRASLDYALLDRASLDHASLNRASLEGASLVGASLEGASLDGASLVGASLYRASLDYALLDRASLVGASLDGASLKGARWDNSTRWPDGFSPPAREGVQA